MYVFRTANSDCCPDYFNHCEGLTPSNDAKYQYQSAAAPLTIVKPLNCPYGLMDISGKKVLHSDNNFYFSFIILSK